MVMINRWRVEQAGDPGDFLDAAHAAVESWNADERLAAVAVLKDRIVHIERDAVEQAIAAGAMWSRIAESLGVSRQAVHRRWAQAAAEPVVQPRRRAVVDGRAAWAAVKAEQERFANEYFDRVRRRAEGEPPA